MPDFRMESGVGKYQDMAGHEMVLELDYGADFWRNRHCKTNPVDLEGSRGQVWPKIGRSRPRGVFNF